MLQDVLPRVQAVLTRDTQGAYSEVKQSVLTLTQTQRSHSRLRCSEKSAVLEARRPEPRLERAGIDQDARAADVQQREADAAPGAVGGGERRAPGTGRSA